jgi:hypothetical protein
MDRYPRRAAGRPFGRHAEARKTPGAGCLEGINAVGVAGLDKTHKEIPDVGAADGPVVKTVLAMEDGGLEESFGHVVIQGRTRFPEETG